ncbi:hypothetical protein CQW23_32132 [Capsicum baccatum]|uniref:F-box domain-containing protein n=1 Tax=Capsicum baccatum TaxID=33114 RepID=A0A2G2V5P5_CAPBA|nr:hypothetical protein CQW23_32132 [Capsicum baccatum]
MGILNRLPVRSLLRFKCISKFWKALISDPYFKMKHLNRAKNDQDFQKLLITHWCRADDIVSLYYCPLSSVQLVENSQKLDIPANFKPTLCGILCCYNGLDVIEVTNTLGGGFTLLLWNPSIRESIVLSSLELPYDEEYHFGLGYDSTSGDYKILHIYQNLGDSHLPNQILA